MKPKIVIIDDEQMILDVLQMSTPREDVDLIFCNTVPEALKVIPFATGIISDVRMPGSQDLEFALQNLNSKTVVYRMTGDLNHPSPNLFRKPFSLKTFKETIDAIIEKSKNQGQV